MNLDTVRELFRYNDWARDRVLTLVAPLDPSALDRRFEMGEGSLRATVGHIHEAEWNWLQRWQGRSPKKGEAPHEFATIQALWTQWRLTADDRDRFLNTLHDADLDRAVTYTNMLGETYSFKVGYMLLHVCNHGTHHRAQAVNMLRHLGVKPPPMDFLVMHAEE